MHSPERTPAPLPALIDPADTPLAQATRGDALVAARRYLDAARADSTWRAYESDWRIFEAWCRDAGMTALPASADTLALFLSAQAAAGRAPSTLGRRLAAIRMAHITANLPSAHESAAVTEVMAGIRRTHGAKPRQKEPAVADLLKRMVDAADVNTHRGRRDRAILLLGFSAALRRSELAALRVEDIRTRGDEGIELGIRRSKTDQEGGGQVVAVPRAAEHRYCPVRALDAWRDHAGIFFGPVFRRVGIGDNVLAPRKVVRRGLTVEAGFSAHSIADVVKTYAEKAGADPADYAGHSLRSGFLTSAARAGASVWKLREVSRHRSVAGVQPYVRDAERFVDHAGTGLLD